MMKYWLFANIGLWAVCIFYFLASLRDLSNMGSAILAGIIGVQAAISTVIYLVVAFWTWNFL